MDTISDGKRDRHTVTMRDTPFYYILFFYEVSLNLLEYLSGYCWDTFLTSHLIVTLTFGVKTFILCAAHLLIMLYLLCTFIKFAAVVYELSLRFVTDGRTDGRTNGAILICFPKFLREHKKKRK